MNLRNLKSSLLILLFAASSSCAQNDAVKEKISQKANSQKESIHSYGSWYCPDNLGTFPPLSASDYTKVPVISKRLPSQEEAQAGLALMYFDPAKYPSAQAVDMELPKLAKYYLPQTMQEELVLVIQVVSCNGDTVAGFRFLNGGNGSSMLNELQFPSEDEAKELVKGSYVFLEMEINRPKEKVWGAVSQTEYMTMLAQRFQNEKLKDKNWLINTNEKLVYKTMEEEARGYLMNLYGSVYLQIDGAKFGQQSTEKILILENGNSANSKIQIVFGPYSNDYEKNKAEWQNWLEEVKVNSEKL